MQQVDHASNILQYIDNIKYDTIRVRKSTPPYDDYIEEYFLDKNILKSHILPNSNKYFIIPASTGLSKIYRYHINKTIINCPMEYQKIPIIYISNLSYPRISIGSFKNDIYDKNQTLIVCGNICTNTFNRGMYDIDYVSHYSLSNVIKDERNIGVPIIAKLYIGSHMVMCSPLIIMKLLIPEYNKMYFK